MSISPFFEEASSTAPRDNIYVKRPQIGSWDEEWWRPSIGPLLLSEALVMERIAAGGPAHPNIVRYHGCRVRNNRLVGIELQKYPISLNQHFHEDGEPPADVDDFVAKVDSAIRHLHSLGLAHNDLNPSNIMLDETGAPVLIDFGSCQPFGGRLKTLGTPGWVDGDFFTSELDHDISALEKLRKWLLDPERQLL